MGRSGIYSISSENLVSKHIDFQAEDPSSIPGQVLNFDLMWNIYSGGSGLLLVWQHVATAYVTTLLTERFHLAVTKYVWFLYKHTAQRVVSKPKVELRCFMAGS